MANPPFTGPGWYYLTAGAPPLVKIDGVEVELPNFQDSSTVKFFLNPSTGNVQLEGGGGGLQLAMDASLRNSGLRH